MLRMTCKCCGEFKPQNQFERAPSTSGRVLFRKTCKVCRTAYFTARQAIRRERIAQGRELEVADRSYIPPTDFLPMPLRILMLYREEAYYHEMNEQGKPVRKGVAEILIEKNRHGPTGYIECAFLAETMRFANLERRHD